MTDRASIIVVNWNGLAHLKRCLPAIEEQTFPETEIILVDNGSTDGSIDWVAQTYPAVTVIANDRNLGFAAANNQGIAVAEGDYVALLNNDAYPEPDWLEALVLAATTHERVGMVASQIRLVDPAEKMDSAGIEVDTLGMAWNRCFGEPPDSCETISEVFGPSGAAGLYRATMLKEIGGFDPRYFMYYEDVELAWRARRAGWRCLYQPRARVRHVHSATARGIPGFKAYQIGLNKWRTLLKHYPFGRLWGWLPLLLIVDAISWLWPLISKGSTAPLQGRLQAWRERRLLWSERSGFGSPGSAGPRLVYPSLKRYSQGLH